MSNSAKPNDGRLAGLARRASWRFRVQRAVDALCLALLPALTLVAVATLLTKHDLLQPDELGGLLRLATAFVALCALVASVWPVDPLGTLMALDLANGLPDRLSSAWAFGQVAESERTPEMRLHIERTQQWLTSASLRPAHAFRRPPDWAPALILALVTGFVMLLAEPDRALPPAVTALPEPAPRHVLDVAALAPELRQIEAIERLAEESDDPAVRALAEDLSSLLAEAERGYITEEELLEAIERIEQQLNDLAETPPPSLAEDLAEVAVRVREIIEDDEALAAQLEEVLVAAEDGDVQALADALDELGTALSVEDLSAEDAEALADLLERFADAFDARDPELLEELAELSERFQELQERFEASGSSRDGRRAEEARERLAEAQQALDQAGESLDEAGQARQDLADGLREAADALRDEPNETGESTDESRPDGDEERETADEGEERRSDGAEELAENQADDDPTVDREPRAGQTGEGRRRDSEGEGDDPGEGEGVADSSDEPSDADPTGEPSNDTDGTAQNPSRPESTDGQSASPTESGQGQDGDASPGPENAIDPGQQAASDELREMAEDLRERERERSQSEARERGQEVTERLRENLQRQGLEGPAGAESTDRETWDDFMERADGASPPDPGEATDGEQRGSADPGEPGGQATEGQQTPPDEEMTAEEGYGTEAGGDALGDEGSELADAERERVEAEVEVSDEGEAGPPLSTSEVIGAAAEGGFASVAYQEIYEQYQETARIRLAEQTVPLGYQRFIERYFDLIEPRR